MNTFLVWIDGDERENGERVIASSSPQAAERFVEDFCEPDSFDLCEVFVCEDREGSTAKQFTVEVETETHYTAFENPAKP